MNLCQFDLYLKCINIVQIASGENGARQADAAETAGVESGESPDQSSPEVTGAVSRIGVWSPGAWSPAVTIPAPRALLPGY